MELSKAKMNQKMKINDLSLLDPLVKRRLKELGVSEGKGVRVKRFCPFGGPCMLEHDGQLISIRKKDTCCIKGDLES